uniref:Uncharacterized protein n=1 Tax=Chromera velia CCMP2878 TaxID=1169474 RepID=A0A0G4HMQ3_9ALVE|eukprot:Cvel_29221.t1-p1 / transcript=Cvel_29221.t1 / gene=Cvel_29221 / organism=Chromera_velia_CCMP2878 / gene_product=Ankyrin repeat and SOCS box protein 2, putative / transcript_product=Ankyrin repeat and SOCS box protein 2, putative / location=Cvel_scaffold3960:9550-10428(+) / protein_length=293 / sequence_SO=supercontig / SO=protein_coding / is_pseudo=false
MGQRTTDAVEESDITGVEEELKGLEDEFLGIVETLREKRRLLAAIKSKGRRSSFSYPSTPLPQEKAALCRLRKAAQEARKSIRKEYNEIFRWNFKADLTPLFRRKVGKVLRSFQHASSQALRTALDGFISQGERDDFRLLLIAGAEVDGLVEGQSALMRAVSAGDSEAVEMLVLSEADLEVKGRGEAFTNVTPLFEACWKRRVEIAEFLLCRGADPNVENHEGLRPLHIAAGRGMLCLVDSLVSHGADLSAQAIDADTALTHASLNGHRNVVDLLLERGAQWGGELGSNSAHH